MRNAIPVGRSVVGVTIVGFVGLVLYALLTIGETIKVTEISTGTLGPFAIGAKKEELLVEIGNESFSPDPKPAECPVNWIGAGMTQTQRGCLMKTDIWHVGHFGQTVCPERTNWHTSLHFKDGALKKAVVRCTAAI